VEGGIKKSKKGHAMYPLAIVKYLSGHQRYEINNPFQLSFIEDLVFYITNGYEVFFFVESP